MTVWQHLNRVLKPNLFVDGDPCPNEGSPCDFKYSVCRRALCHCQPGYFHRDGKCLAELGERVDDTTECGASGPKEVRGSRCVCRENFFYSPSLRLCNKRKWNHLVFHSFITHGFAMHELNKRRRLVFSRVYIKFQFFFGCIYL